MERAIRILGKRYQLTSDDDYLDAMGAEFEPHMAELFQSLVGPGDVVADVGGNIGLTAILFAGLAAKVHVFEPSPSTFAILQENLRRAETRNVEAVNLGLGERKESLAITFAYNNRSGGFVSDKMQPGAGHITEQIEIDTLDHYFAGQPDRIDVIKIDVEGYEANVVKGCEQIFKKYKPVVTLELNHFCLNVLRRVTVPDFLDYLRSVFPFLYAVDSDNITIADLHQPEQAYYVMHQHLTGFRFPNIVAGFDASVTRKLDQLKANAQARRDAPPALAPTAEVSDARGHVELDDLPDQMRAGEGFFVGAVVHNTSDCTWDTAGDRPVRLCYHWQDADGAMVLFDGERSLIDGGPILPGQKMQARMKVVAPPVIGQLRLVATLVQDGVCWFEDRGFQLQPVSMRVVARF
jgi:FkbM family methyltransferase